jgi:putative ABC transport system permease protein
VIAVRNLLRNKLRNLLTLLGVAAGIAVFVTSHTVSAGFEDQIAEIIRKYSINLTVQSKGAATPIMSRIDISDYLELRDVEGVGDVSSVILGSIRTPWNPYFIIAGISSAEALSTKFTLVEGRFFVPGKREILLGKLAAERLDYHPGNKILLPAEELFTITGLYSFGSRMLDGAAIFDLEDAQRLLRSDGYVNLAFIQVKPGNDVRQVTDEISERFPHLSAIPSADFSGQVRMFNTINVFVWVLSLISFFTCCVVVMNTLLMAVSERTKEIGILMAVGWSRFMVYRMILKEAIMICLAGGVAGNIAGLLFLFLLNGMKALGVGWIPLSIPAGVALKSLALSVVLGIASSLYPAIVAVKLLPAESLRYE